MQQKIRKITPNLAESHSFAPKPSPAGQAPASKLPLTLGSVLTLPSAWNSLPWIFLGQLLILLTTQSTLTPCSFREAIADQTHTTILSHLLLLFIVIITI